MGLGSPELRAPANLPRQLVIDLLAARCEWFEGIRLVVGADVEQRRLLRGVLTHLTQFLRFIHHNALRLVLFPLRLALGLVSLFLLARLFFLALGKR